METLRKRSDFLKAAKARKQPSPGFLLQMRKRNQGEATGARVGFTASKKVGNAVVRNRAKRRLRALAHQVLTPLAQDGCDYVLIARAGTTTTRAFSDLEKDLKRALHKIHSPQKPRKP